MIEDAVRPNLSSLPPYVPGENPEQAGVIKLASNENPLGPSPLAMEFIKKSLSGLSVYPDQHASLLKEALAEKLSVSADNLIVGNGSDEIMFMAAAAFLTAGEEAIISKNTFSSYEFVCRLMDGRPVMVDLKNYAYDLEGMLAALTPKSKLIFICSPNNPTGTISPRKELESFLSRVPENVIVVIDEAYREYVESSEYPDTIKYIKDRPNLLVLRTFSKIYGLAGLRVGYGIASEKLIKYLRLVKLPFNVNGLALAAREALKDEGFVQKSIKNNQEGKKYLYTELNKLGLKNIPTEANFIFVELGQEADMVFINLMKEGVIVRPLSSFGFKSALRVTIGTPEQNKKFIGAMKKVL